MVKGLLSYIEELLSAGEAWVKESPRHPAALVEFDAAQCPWSKSVSTALFSTNQGISTTSLCDDD